METYEEKSYQSHKDHYQKVYDDPASINLKIHNWKETDPKQYFIHERSWKLTDSLTSQASSWLTVGDGYGADASYLIKKGCVATATDISGTMLEAAHREGLIDNFSVENVEQLSYSTKSFDYVYCKESYHHFPRPFMGLYEMIRVSRKAVVIQEPVDVLLAMPWLLFIKNILDRINPLFLRKFWKNQYSFEVAGNFVYKVSEREFEKAAIAIGLPAVAFKGYNHSKGKPNQSLESTKKNLSVRDFLSRIGILPYEQLSSIIFREKPDTKTQAGLKAEGYRYIEFPPNPYSK